MATENLLYNNLSQALDASVALTFSVFTALEPLKKLGPIIAPLWNLSDGIIGIASGGYQLYYTGRYAKANHIRKKTLACTDILTSALLVATTATSLPIGGPFGFAGAMWYAAARSAEAAYRAKQKMNLPYLFDNRLEKLRFVHDKLTQLDLDEEENRRLKSIKNRLEIQLLAIAVETFHVRNILDARLNADNFKKAERQEYEQQYQKFNAYHEYFSTTIKRLGKHQRSSDNIEPDYEQPSDNPYSQFQTAYTRNTIDESTASSPALDEDDDETTASLTAHWHMPRERAKAITQYLYDKQREKYIAKTRTTLIWGAASIGMTLMAIAIVCPYTAPVLAPIGLSFCLAVAALKTYDLYQDFSDWRARCKLEKQVLSKMKQGNTANLEVSAPLTISALTATQSSPGSESHDPLIPEDGVNHSLDPSSSSSSLSESASSDSIADIDEDMTTAVPVVTSEYTPTPSLSTRFCSFFRCAPLPEGFETEVRQEVIKRYRQHSSINQGLDETALSDKDFIQLKTLAGRLPTDDETQANCPIFSCCTG